MKKDTPTRKNKFGCVMLFLKFPQIKKLHRVINIEDIYEDEEDSSYGLENEPHVTLLYGLHEEVSDDDVRDVLKGFEFTDIKLQNISSFNNEKYDVLKYDVENDGLHKANELLKKFPYTNDYPQYHPHLTIGYLKKGTAKKYIKDLKESKFVLNPGYVVYSKVDGSKIKIKLK